jgi:hypothetical protein
MTTTATSPLARSTGDGDGDGDGDGEVSVAVQTELMMDYRMISPFADASKSLAAAAFETSQAGFFTITSTGGVAMVTPDPGSDTGWGVTDLQFPSTYGTVIDIAAYQDWYSATVVWACTSDAVYYASSLLGWAWTAAQLGQPAGSVIGGVRGLNCAYANQPSVVAVEIEQTNYSLPQSQLYCQPSGQPAYNNLITYPGAFLDWSAGPVLLPGVASPQPGAFVCEPGCDAFSEPAGVQCIGDNPESTALFLPGTYPVLATALNSSGALEAFVIDADDNNSLNYLSPTSNTFTKVPIAQTPGDNGQPVTSYPIGSVAAVTDLSGIIHVIACTTTGTVLHIAASANSATGWSIAAPIIELNSPAEITATTDEDGDVHVFARADRTGVVSHLLLAAATTGDWTTETISVEVPHQDYVQQIATYSATLSVMAANGMPGCGVPYYVGATEPVTVQIDGGEAELDKEIICPGITGPDGQVVIVWPTSSLSMPTLYAWFDGMPQTDRVAIDMSGPIQATISDVRTGEQLLKLPTHFSYKTDYTSGNLLEGVDAEQADNAAAGIHTVMGLTNQAEACDDRLHPSSKPHAARYLADWDGTPVDRIDRTGRPDQYFRLNFTGDRPLFEPLDADGAKAAKAELVGAGSWLPDVSWTDVFAAVADAAGSVTNVVVNAVGNAIDATITMVVAGVTYVWDAVVGGVGQLLDLVQTIFASLAADFWALLGWLGWVFNWNDILLTHEAISYFLTNGIAWAKYALGQVQGTIDQAITGVQADIAAAVAAYLAQVPTGSTVASTVQAQPGPPAGKDLSGDPRNVFVRGLRANGNNATVKASDVPPSPPVVTAADSLLSQFGGYATAASGSTELQAIATLAEPTKANPTGLADRPLASVVQTVADSAVWGLGLVQDGVDAMFGLAADAIDLVTTNLTETWDIPLVTDIYKWVTNGADLSALDVSCLLLAVPATITYKLLFGETPVPDKSTLAAIKAAYPPPPAQGRDPAPAAAARALASTGTGQDATPTPIQICARLGNVLTGLSYIACGFFEAKVDLQIAMWFSAEGKEMKVPRCPVKYRETFWTGKPGEIWERMYVLTEIMAAAFSGVVTFAPNRDNWDCGTAEGMANWLWGIGHLQWVLDGISLYKGTVIQELWFGGGPAILSIWGAIQVILQIVGWFRLGAKGWPGTLGGILTSLPNLGKYLMSPQVQAADDGLPLPALVEAAIDMAGNYIGGVFYVLNAVTNT